MTATQTLDDRNELVDAIEAFDRRRQHLHQLPALLGHVAAKQALERGIGLEQPPVKERSGIVGNRRNRCETRLNKGLLVQGQHGCPSS
jgi:hypothetical protein